MSARSSAAGGPGPRRTGFGVVLPFPGIRLADHRDALGRLADAGVTDVWSGETNGLDAVTTLAAAAAWQPSLGVGTGVVPASTRGPAVLAMTAAALAELDARSVTIGVGAGARVAVEAWNSIPYTRPAARVRDTVAFLRSALGGERVDRDYETFSVHGFRLARPPRTAPQIMVGALRPHLLDLAGRDADGAVITCVGAGDVAEVSRHLPPDARLASWLQVCPDPDTDRVRAWARPMLAAYLSVPAYAGMQRWLGRADRLDGLWTAWAAGDRRGAAAAIPDDVIDELIVHGTPARCAESLRHHVDAGVGEPVIAVQTFDTDPVAAAVAVADAFTRHR